MSSPRCSRTAAGAVEGADERPAVDHADPVGQVEHLVELGRHQQHGGALVAEADDLAVDELDRADVEPAGRLGHHEELRIARELAGDDHLLLVAARQRRGGDAAGRGADVEAGHEVGGAVPDGALVAEARGGRTAAAGSG